MAGLTIILGTSVQRMLRGKALDQPGPPGMLSKLGQEPNLQQHQPKLKGSSKGTCLPGQGECDSSRAALTHIVMGDIPRTPGPSSQIPSHTLCCLIYSELSLENSNYFIPFQG